MLRARLFARLRKRSIGEKTTTKHHLELCPTYALRDLAMRRRRYQCLAYEVATSNGNSARAALTKAACRCRLSSKVLALMQHRPRSRCDHLDGESNEQE